MAKRGISKPEDWNRKSQLISAKGMANFLEVWVSRYDLLPQAEHSKLDPKYSIGVRGLILKGWGLGFLSNWDYEMVDSYILIVKRLEELGIVKLQPTNHLPDTQPEHYFVAVPNLENLRNASTIIEAEMRKWV